MAYNVGGKVRCIKEDLLHFVKGEVYEISYVGKAGCTVLGRSILNSTMTEWFDVLAGEYEEENESRVIFDVPLKYELSHIKLFTRDGQDTIILQTYDDIKNDNGKYGIIVRDSGKVADEISFEENWSNHFSIKFPATKLTPDEVRLIKEFADSLPEDAREEVLRVARVIKSKRKQKSALPNPSTESEETYGQREITFNVDDIKILGRGRKTENIILQVLDDNADTGKTGIILRNSGKSETSIDYRASWSSSFVDELNVSELRPNEIQLILDFATSLTSECREARDAIINLISQPKKNVSCVLWAEPMIDVQSGKHNTGDKALIDIYKAFARTAYDKLGRDVITSQKKSRNETIPIGEIVMITKVHFDIAMANISKNYGDDASRDIMETLLFMGEK